MKVSLTRKASNGNCSGEATATLETDDLDFIGLPSGRIEKLLKNILPKEITVPVLNLSDKQSAALLKDMISKKENKK